jgi:ParB family chromosome partitioning protein
MQCEPHQIEFRFQDLRVGCPQREERLAASILKHGQQSPVVVVRDGDGLVLIDGYARCAALERLGEDLIETVEVELSVEEALLWRHRSAASARRSVLEDAWLVAALSDDFGLSQEEIGRKLSRSQSWVSRRLGLVRVLPKSVQNAVRKGRVPGRAAELYLVPMTRVIRDHCERLVNNLGPKVASIQDIERIYKAWRPAEPDKRVRIVDHPWLFLATARELERETPDPLDEVAKVQRDLEAAAALCRRVRRSVRDGLVVHAESRAAVHWAWKDVVQAVQALRRPIEEVTHAGQGHTDRGVRASSEGARDAGDSSGAEDQPERSEASASSG